MSNVLLVTFCIFKRGIYTLWTWIMMCRKLRVICAIFWSKICVCAIFLRFSISVNEKTTVMRYLKHKNFLCFLLLLRLHAAAEAASSKGVRCRRQFPSCPQTPAVTPAPHLFIFFGATNLNFLWNHQFKFSLVQAIQVFFSPTNLNFLCRHQSKFSLEQPIQI